MRFGLFLCPGLYDSKGLLCSSEHLGLPLLWAAGFGVLSVINIWHLTKTVERELSPLYPGC